MSSTSPPAITLAELAGQGSRPTAILTVNNRLARRIVAELSTHLQAHGIDAAAAPSVMPFSAWVEALAEQTAFHGPSGLPAHRLDDFAARLLWRDAVLHDDAQPLLDAHEAARLAAEAEHLVQEWQVQADGQPHEEYTQFLRWRRQYHSQLRACDADDADTRINFLLTQLDDGHLRLPEQIVLAGMRETSPRQQRLFAILQARGVLIYQLSEPVAVAAQVQRHAAPDPGNEWLAAAGWAARQLRHGDGRYAIVAADLQNQAPFARRILRRVLGDTPFNVSVGRPLQEWPLVGAALIWLRLLAQTDAYAPADLARAMQAGHCRGDLREAAARAGIDAQWRFDQTLSLSPTDWLHALRPCPLLAQAWQEARAIFDAQGARRQVCGAADWAERMRASLAALGFPGDAPLDSTAYQVFEAFQSLLQRYAALAQVARDLNPQEAVHLLARLARETPFQPERDAHARLDVLGLLEAEGERWDGVWILGLTDDVLPAPPSPNPLLPAAALAQANAPRATAARELAYAQALFQALLDCAPHVIVSHAVLDGEQELSPSPLLTELPVFDMPQPDAPADDPPRVVLEYLAHDPGPPLDADASLSGGTAILEAQARNPLWAFVRYRLGARQMPAHARQLPSAALRGNFLHRAMQALWQKLGSSRTLAEHHASGTLSALLESVISAAADQELSALSPALRALESARARQVLEQWLALEMQRQPFDIEHVEGKQLWQHGALRLTLRLDRVDRLPSGELLVLDYKCGALLDIKGWIRERPVSLQLPCYAAVLGQDGATIGALMLAHLTARKVGAVGVSGMALGIPDIHELHAEAAQERKPSPFAMMGWPDWLAHWQQSITRLADEFIAGHAANHTVHPGDLQYCEVMPFLRVDLETDPDEGAVL